MSDSPQREPNDDYFRGFQRSKITQVHPLHAEFSLIQPHSASFRPNHIISTKEDGWELSPFHHIRNFMETAQFERKKRPLIRTKVCALA